MNTGIDYEEKHEENRMEYSLKGHNVNNTAEAIIFFYYFKIQFVMKLNKKVHNDAIRQSIFFI